MLKSIEVKKKLEEMISSKKADNSILITLNNNEIEIEKLKNDLEISNNELSKILDEIEILKLEKSQMPIYRVKDIALKMREISNMKKQYKEKVEEISNLNEICDSKLNENAEMCKLINNQYAIYQENEIYAKAIDKVTQNNIELSNEFHSSYINHINKYMNSIFSIVNDTRLDEPDHNDLATLLEVLQKNENRLKNTKNRTTRKKSTKESDINEEKKNNEIDSEEKDATKKENKETPEKSKITRKKTTKEEPSKNAEEKKTTRKKTTKKEPSEEKKENEVETQEDIKPKKVTRKKTTKIENNEDQMQENVTDKKSTKGVQSSAKKLVTEKKEKVEKKQEDSETNN